MSAAGFTIRLPTYQDAPWLLGVVALALYAGAGYKRPELGLLGEAPEALNPGLTFYRIQPRGRSLKGHVSMTSNDEPLPDGYLFAHNSPQEVVHSWREWGYFGRDPRSLEVVTFRGRDYYYPGDVEGVAVYPYGSKGVRRRSLKGFLAKYDPQYYEESNPDFFTDENGVVHPVRKELGDRYKASEDAVDTAPKSAHTAGMETKELNHGTLKYNGTVIEMNWPDVGTKFEAGDTIRFQGAEYKIDGFGRRYRRGPYAYAYAYVRRVAGSPAIAAKAPASAGAALASTRFHEARRSEIADAIDSGDELAGIDAYH